MSRVYEALRRAEALRSQAPGPVPVESSATPSAWPQALAQAAAPASVAESEFASLRPRAAPASRLVALLEWEGLGAEKFRLLAARLLHLQERFRAERELRRVLCASSIAGEGKSVVAANLALALARTSRKKVLLLEGDLRQPALGEMFGIGTPLGLADWALARTAPLTAGAEPMPPPLTHFIYRLEGLDLCLLPAGKAQVQPLEFLESAAATHLLMLLSGWFDWVIIDSPPLLPLADGNGWSRLSDGLLLVVRQDFSRQGLLQRALRGLDQPNLLGILVNASTEAGPAYDVPRRRRHAAGAR